MPGRRWPRRKLNWRRSKAGEAVHTGPEMTWRGAVGHQGHHHPLETTETVTMAGGETLWMTETGIVIGIGETTEKIIEEMTDRTEIITVGTEDREGRRLQDMDGRLNCVKKIEFELTFYTFYVLAPHLEFFIF